MSLKLVRSLDQLFGMDNWKDGRRCLLFPLNGGGGGRLVADSKLHTDRTALYKDRERVVRLNRAMEW